MNHEKWEPVPQADFSMLSPDDFKGVNMDFRQDKSTEESMPYFLQNFSRIANHIVEDGPQRGYMDAVIWRVPSSNQPFNARVMESHLSIAFFYCTKAKWNQYYAMPSVKVRLEAMLDYLLSLQLPNGMFPEYGVALGNLPATAFFTKFAGETLRMLNNGPPIREGLLQKFAEADRKAIHIVLTDEGLIKHGWKFSNQFTNVWAGGLAYLSMYPDAELEEMLLRSMRDETFGRFQSETGFFYEENQADWGYTLHTHNSNERYAWFYAKGTPFEEPLLDGARRYYDWLSYNCLREPDGSGFLFNSSIESRQRFPFARCIENELAEKVELARAFTMDTDEAQAFSEAKRQLWTAKWPVFREADINYGGSFTPYSFLFEYVPKWNPTKEEKEEQIRQLPYIKSRRFIHQRMDSRTQMVNLYIRRENYYCAFNSGELYKPQQRFGLGFLWDEKAGMLIQSQSASDLAVWGFSRDGEIYEKSLGIKAVYYKLNGRRTSPVIGCADWQDETLSVEYGERGDRKVITFEDNLITVENRFKGDITEHIPLMILPDDRMTWDIGSFTLYRGEREFRIDFNTECGVRMDMLGKRARYQLAVLSLSSGSGVRYTVTVI